jgi:hypothetical protein
MWYYYNNCTLVLSLPYTVRGRLSDPARPDIQHSIADVIIHYPIPHGGGITDLELSHVVSIIHNIYNIYVYLYRNCPARATPSFLFLLYILFFCLFSYRAALFRPSTTRNVRLWQLLSSLNNKTFFMRERSRRARHS